MHFCQYLRIDSYYSSLKASVFLAPFLKCLEYFKEIQNLVLDYIQRETGTYEENEEIYKSMH